MPNIARCVLFFLFATALARADIAPAVFTGTDIFPLQNSNIRMAAADVRITWGAPCDLEARFSMVNESDRAEELEVGFPVGAYSDAAAGPVIESENEPPAKIARAEVGPEVIKIIVNGQPVSAYRRTRPERLKELRHEVSWYFARISFRPGPSVVDVRTHLQPSGTGAPYDARLSYCISTGGRWKGPIGWESVEIIFPGHEAASLVDGAIPKGGRAQGESVRWEFEAFEPQRDEYDIDFEFRLPAVARKLAELRAVHERNPADDAAALRYARHLFCLGAAKGNAGFPPEELSAASYERVLGLIKHPEDRRKFVAFYPLAGDRYRSPSTEWTEARTEMRRILADAGYCADYRGLVSVQQAKALVEACLARNPRNAAAWNLHLAHFWRFSFAAAGHWFGGTVYSHPLRAAIESAYRNCPKDPTIRAWRDAMKKNGTPPTMAEPHPGEMSDAFKNEFTVGVESLLPTDA